MKRALFTLPWSTLLLTGCQTANKQPLNISTLYLAMFAFSLLLLLAYLTTVKRKNAWMVLLFSAVPVVNGGYLWLSLSTVLDSALWANRLSYLGSVFLPLSMLMIVMNVTATSYKPKLPLGLIGVALAIFLLAASPGFSTLYYRDVTLEIINGATTLNKEYGILHPLYMLYLLAYFVATIMVVIRTKIRKDGCSTAHALIVTFAVFINLGLWLFGQFIYTDFEFLSVSYIISELFLLGLQYILQATPSQTLKPAIPQTESSVQKEGSLAEDEELSCFRDGISHLTRTERRVFDLYLEGKTTKEVMHTLNITENTLKYHNKNIYSKLGVTSRKQLLELAKHVQSL